MPHEIVLLVLLVTGTIGKCGGAEPLTFKDGDAGGSDDGGAGGSVETTMTSSSSSMTTTDGGSGAGGSEGGSGGAGGTTTTSTTSTTTPAPTGASCVDDAGCASGHCVPFEDPSMGALCNAWQPIGSECETSADCESSRCSTLPDNDQGAIGICTQTPCGNDDNCGPSGVCRHNDVVGGWYCHRACDTDLDCYEPFVCTVDGTCGITITSQP